MAYRVFLSHNTTQEDMVIVWRLQTLAAASGLHLDVPNPAQRSNWNTVAQMISEADAVIAFITKRVTQQVITELNHALLLNRLTIVIAEQGIPIGAIQSLLQGANSRIFILNSERPWEMEQQLSQFLQEQRLNKDAKNALLAVAGAFIGLLLLQELTKS